MTKFVTCYVNLLDNSTDLKQVEAESELHALHDLCLEKGVIEKDTPLATDLETYLDTAFSFSILIDIIDIS